MPNFKNKSEIARTPNDDIMNEIIADMGEKRESSVTFGRRSSRVFGTPSEFDDKCKLE